MPEKVTREEKIVELAILKAREVKALRDGLTKDEMPTIEKVKRPKAEKADKIENQTQKKEGYGLAGDEFKGKSIKKAFNKAKMITAVRSARAFVIEGDRKIEKELAKGVLNEEETKEIKQLKIQVEAVYKELTKQMNQLSRSKGGYGDFKKDDRDVEFTEEQQKMADETFAALERAFDKITSEYLTAPLNKQGKMESDMKQIMNELKKLTSYLGRTS